MKWRIIRLSRDGTRAWDRKCTSCFVLSYLKSVLVKPLWVLTFWHWLSVSVYCDVCCAVRPPAGKLPWHGIKFSKQLRVTRDGRIAGLGLQDCRCKVSLFFLIVHLMNCWTMWWWLSPRWRGIFENVRPFISSLRFCFCFYLLEISSYTQISLFIPGSVHSGSASWNDCLVIIIVL